jgi:hypothetical protein
VVGVDVGVEHPGEREAELVDQAQVALELLGHRVDQRAPGRSAGSAIRYV